MAALLQHTRSIPSSFNVSVLPQQNLPSRPRSARVSTLKVRAEAVQTAAINPDIKKDVDKVVDTVVASELSKPLTAYCRCWRSKIFPLCDGTHVKHNKATGDNVGPLLVKK